MWWNEVKITIFEVGVKREGREMKLGFVFVVLERRNGYRTPFIEVCVGLEIRRKRGWIPVSRKTHTGI